MNFIRRPKKSKVNSQETPLHEMAAVYASIKDVLSIKVKVRYDGYCEQYSRIFMMKLLVIGSMIIGLNWYTDKTMCIMPPKSGLSADFVGDACWIQGFYIYEDIGYDPDEVPYYGIPSNLDYDGKYDNGKLCIKDSPRPKKDDIDCKRLKKQIFAQYQYMPFFTAALALLYYIPHVVYKIFNSDLISLKENIRDLDADTILKNYFDYKMNSRTKMKARVLGNLFIKLMYIASNVGSYLAIDNILYGKYRNFGWVWGAWMSLDTSKINGYLDMVEPPKPANTLLPTFGICEVRILCFKNILLYFFCMFAYKLILLCFSVWCCVCTF